MGGSDRVANIQSGVLQGDPLCPLLFNMVLDWALSNLPQAVGAMVNGVRFQYLAFADVIVLTASSRVGLQLAMDVLMRQALKVGLRPGLAKCATLTIIADTKRGAWYTDTQQFLINGERVRALDPQSFYKYLGAQVGQNIGNPEELIAGFSAGLTNILRAPMKPQQKFYMVQKNLIPKFVYPALHTDLEQGRLRELDLVLRRGVRTLLHLPNDTPLGFFYEPLKAGGLGLCCFETRVVALRDEMLRRLATSSPDPTVVELARGIIEDEGKEHE